MSLGPIMLDIDGEQLTAEDREVLMHPLVGGVILFSRNYRSRVQIAELTDAIHALRHPPLLIAVDQEGGRIQRFREDFTPLPPALALGQRYDSDGDRALADARDFGLLIAVELRTVGVDFSFAPVLDLHARSNSVIGDRAFHRDPDVVGRIARAFIRGLREGGMGAVGKHFPGHGSVHEDSHHVMPIDKRSYYDISRRDMLPFRLLVESDLDGVMPAHVLFPEVDNLPAGFSPVWLQTILRSELHFRGAIFSDDISMTGAAMAGNHVDRAGAALSAGCDMVLICNNREAAVTVIGKLDLHPEPLAQVRLMRLHGRRTPCTAQQLATEDHWKALTQRVAGFNINPELGLDDEDLA